MLTVNQRQLYFVTYVSILGKWTMRAKYIFHWVTLTYCNSNTAHLIEEHNNEGKFNRCTNRLFHAIFWFWSCIQRLCVTQAQCYFKHTLEFDVELFSWHESLWGNNNERKKSVEMCVHWHQWSQVSNTSIPLYWHDGELAVWWDYMSLWLVYRCVECPRCTTAWSKLTWTWQIIEFTFATTSFYLYRFSL